MQRFRPFYLTLTLLCATLFVGETSFSKPPTAEVLMVAKRIRAEGELAPLPEVQPLLIQLADHLESPELAKAIAKSPFLQGMQRMVKISLFHLNLKFNILEPGYPYGPPFEKPFPIRPTLEAMDEAARFLELVAKTTGLTSPITAQLRNSPYFESLQLAIASKQTAVATEAPRAFTARELIEKTVDTFVVMHDRLTEFGETAPMPEFARQVKDVLRGLNAPEVKAFAETDAAFAAERNAVIETLVSTAAKSGPATNLQASFHAPFPYRRTIQAIERGLLALDLRIRATLPEIEDWHRVELSHYIGDKPMLRPLYHTQRYKYEMFGLLANPDVVVLPFGDINMEDLIRMRAAPWALLGETTKVRRIDRFWHTPYEEWVHDGNHARRMYFYDKLKWERLGIETRDQKIALYREQDAFISRILNETKPTTGIYNEDELRKLERVIIFETPHETALTPDRESLMKDMMRGPRVPQPFERMRRGRHVDLEADRTFDGNHLSGALHFKLDLRTPTEIDRYLDRAQGFLTNVDNKLRVGFYDSPFAVDTNLANLNTRTPRMLAKAATRLMRRIGYKPPHSEAVLASMIEDRSGQPELDNYYSLNERDRDVVERVRLERIRVAQGGRAGDTTVDSFLAAPASRANRCEALFQIAY